MKVILLLSFVSYYGSAEVETLRFEMPDIAHCESVVENLKDIYSIDPSFESFKVSTNCVNMPAQESPK